MTRNITADGATPRNPADRGQTRCRAMRFFTVNEVAEIVGVSVRTVRRWIKSGRLVAHRVRGVVRISPSDLEAFLCQHRDV
jgi:excisionase family DNA binding protein